MRSSRVDADTPSSPPPAAVVRQDPPLNVSAVGSVHRDPTHPPVANATTGLGTPRRPQTPPPTLSVREVKVFASVGKDVVVGVPPCNRQVAITAGGVRGDVDNFNCGEGPRRRRPAGVGKDVVVSVPPCDSQVSLTAGGVRGVKLLCCFGDSKVRLEGRGLGGKLIYNVV